MHSYSSEGVSMMWKQNRQSRERSPSHLAECSCAVSRKRRLYEAAPRPLQEPRVRVQVSRGPGWGPEGLWCRWVAGRRWGGCRWTSGCRLQTKWPSTGPKLRSYSPWQNWGTVCGRGWGKRRGRWWIRAGGRRTCGTAAGICYLDALRSRGPGLWRRKVQGTWSIQVRQKLVSKRTSSNNYQCVLTRKKTLTLKVHSVTFCQICVSLACTDSQQWAYNNDLSFDLSCQILWDIIWLQYR